jgi:hypothetical protein
VGTTVAVTGAYSTGRIAAVSETLNCSTDRGSLAVLAWRTAAAWHLGPARMSRWRKSPSRPGRCGPGQLRAARVAAGAAAEPGGGRQRVGRLAQMRRVPNALAVPASASSAARDYGVGRRPLSLAAAVQEGVERECTRSSSGWPAA